MIVMNIVTFYERMRQLVQFLKLQLLQSATAKGNTETLDRTVHSHTGGRFTDHFTQQSWF